MPVGQDSSLLLDDTVHVCGIVTVGTDIFYVGAGVSFYMQDSQGGPFSGIFVYYYDNEPIPSLVRGDSVCFLGVVSEYPWPYDPPYTSNMTEIFVIPGSLQIISPGHPLPPPMIITSEMIDSTNGADSLAEQYEACPVRVCYATVDSVIPYTTTSIWICHDTTSHQFIVREASDSIDYLPPPVTTFRYVQGVIYQRFGAYNVQPAYIQDISLLESPVITNAGHMPENPTSNDTITIGCTVTDDGEVIQVDLHYRINLGAWMQVAMEEGNDNEYCFIFPPFSPGCHLNYRIRAEDDENNIVYWPIDNYMTIIIDDPSVINKDVPVPGIPSLCQNYPNPFNASTIISFTLPEASFVTLKLFDMLGREVAILIKDRLAEGTHSIEFKDMNLAGGIYFYQIKADDFTRTKRMILLK